MLAPAQFVFVAGFLKDTVTAEPPITVVQGHLEMLKYTIPARQQETITLVVDRLAKPHEPSGE